MMTVQNTKELLTHLQEKAGQYDLAELKNNYRLCIETTDKSDISQMNHKFNLETLISLKENDGNFFAESLNIRYLEKFRDTINAYMDKYAPGDENLKNYIRQLNCYRTFIQKVPMHPVGLTLEQGRVLQKGKHYYCTAKKFYMNQPDSLCRFCVAKISEL